MDVNEETLALDVIYEVGLDNDFIRSKHTATNYRKDWYLKLFERRNYDSWKKAEGRTMRQHAQEKALDILEQHKPEPLPPDVQQKPDQIVGKASS